MADHTNDFHDFAIKSALFKGRSDWYFCFLKSEKIAHVLTVLSDRGVGEAAEGLWEASRRAGMLPQTVAHFAAGEVDPGVVLADIFSLLSTLRLLQTAGMLAAENAQLLVQEYQALAEKFAASMHLSPFAALDDFVVPNVEAPPESLSLLGSAFDGAPGHGDGSSKGHLSTGSKRHSLSAPKAASSEQQERTARILDIVRQNKRVSIKDIARVVQDCSEKTIQRELGVLINQGLVKKVGERRWSVYIPL